MANLTLADLDALPIDKALQLSFKERDTLLDLILRDSLKNVGKQPERQVGLMSDYFEEDMVRLTKIRAIKIRCGGFIPVDASGEVPGLVPKEQFKLVFSNLKTALEAMGSKPDRIVNLIIFLKNMDYWRPYHELSTCFFLRWFSEAGRGRTPYLQLRSCFLANAPDHRAGQLPMVDTPGSGRRAAGLPEEYLPPLLCFTGSAS